MSLYEAFDPYCSHDLNNKNLFQGTYYDFLYNVALAGWEKFHNGVFGDFCSSPRMILLTQWHVYGKEKCAEIC
jgi:hypothetical protein